MTEVVPLATPQSAAVHISELIREAKSIDVILDRLANKAAATTSAPHAHESTVATTEGNAVDDDVAPEASALANPLDSIDSDGRTAFHWCLALKRFDLALALAEKGCAVATIDLDSTTTLTTACAVDAPSEVLTLIAEKAKGYYYFPKLSGGQSPAADVPAPPSASNPMVNIVGTHFWNIADTAGNTPLLYLASRGNVKGLRVVLSLVSNDAALRYRPAERAEEAKQRHQAYYASLSKGAARDDDDTDATSPVSTSPKTAAHAHNGAAGSSTSPTSLSDSASAHPKEGEGGLLAPLPAYCDVFAQNNRLQTALHRAVSKGSQDFVEELLIFIKKHGADAASVRNFINAPDNQGNTVLHYASMENNEDLGKYLLRNGASRDAKNKKGHEFWQL